MDRGRHKDLGGEFRTDGSNRRFVLDLFGDPVAVDLHSPSPSPSLTLAFGHQPIYVIEKR